MSVKNKLFVTAGITGLIIATGGLVGLLLVEVLIVAEAAALGTCAAAGISSAISAFTHIEKEVS